MTTTTFALPDLGEGLAEAIVVRWLVAVGDVIEADQPVVEVETEKATVEVPCPYAGRVEQLHGAEGESLPVGGPLVTVVPATGNGRTTTAEHDSGAVLVGYGTSSGQGPRKRRTAAPRAAVVPTSPLGAAARNTPRSTPPVRKLARDAGVDLTSLVGSGPGGLITRDDVLARAGGGEPTSDRVPVTGIRDVVARKMAAAHREVPQVTTWVEVDATELLAWRDAVAEAVDVKVTPFVLVLRACVEGLRRHPQLNASFDEAANEIVLHRAVHLGIGVQTERGLTAPVVRHAERLTTAELAKEVARLADAARAGALAAEELRGSTFTASNFGVFGVDGGTPIVNHPEAAIVGLGRIVERPWVHHGELCVRPVMQLTLGFDHRVCDGREAAGFLRFVADCVERPARLLAAL